jgi:preprotein translocase subunit SecA
MLNPFAKIFGSSNDRIIKKMMRHVNDANNLEKELAEKSDDYFLNLKLELKELYENNNKDMYAILPLAFAAVREAS